MLFCCPACGKPLLEEPHALRCENGHSYDRAKQGYVHLLPVKQMHAKIPGDTRQMVDARRNFLALGHYDVFREKLQSLTAAHLPAGGTVLDAGCGEGFYTAALFETAAEKQGRCAGFDISKFAVKAAAGRYKDIDFAVASIFHIPVADGAADVLTDVFAPIVPDEFYRVLKPGGVLILAVPGPRHLFGLKEVLYRAPYENEEKDTDYAGFTFLGRERVARTVTVVGTENLLSLFSMTPYYWKTDVQGGERLRHCESIETELQFDFLIYKRT